MGRLLAIVIGFAVIAVSVPRMAPVLLARISHASPPDTAQPVAAQEPARIALSARRVALTADPHGHFVANVAINGRKIEMMVDTGATIVALNESTARRLGITPARSEFTVPLSTVNGIVKSAPVMLSEIRLDGITLRDVQAVVVPGSLLEVNLLGMSFLGRLSSFQAAANQLILVE